MRSITLGITVGVLLLVVCTSVTCAADRTFGESSFTGWGGAGYSSAGFSTISTGPASSGGNPGSYVRIRTSISAPGWKAFAADRFVRTATLASRCWVFSGGT
jgi:hypothetical protein